MNTKLFCGMKALLCAALLLPSASIGWGQDTSDETRKRTAKVVDGKIVIVDSDGKTKTIELGDGGAKGIVLEQEVQADGTDEKKTARAIIIGPDGERQVVELDGIDGAGRMWVPGTLRGRILQSGDGEGRLLDLSKLSGIADLGISLEGNKFMIGVSCTPGEDGLVVEEVVEDSPAAGAGLQKADVIAQVGDDDVSSIEQLVEAVQEAGNEDSKLRFIVRRGDEDLSFEIKPEKRKAASWSFDVTGEDDEEIREKIQGLLKERGLPGSGDFRFERFGPGIIQGRLGGSDQQKQIDELKKEIEELKKIIRDLRDK